MSIIQVQAVTHRYQKGSDTLTACEAISLEIEEGEFVVLLGPSGCGKTTLLKIISGLLQPTKGDVWINGQVVDGPNRQCGFVFQEFNLLPWRTVAENIAFVLEARGLAKEERQPCAQEWIDLVGLSGFEGHYPAELSGGMRQRVGLARALSIRPKILAMDEPFGALDAQTREVLQRELLRLWNQDKKTAIFVTHDVDEAIYLADRIIVMAAAPGRLTAELTVPFPRPRWNHKREIVASQEFVDLKLQIYSLLGLN